METIKLNQWRVCVENEYKYIFTDKRSSEEDAMAVAVATYGVQVSELHDEGRITVKLTNPHLHAANKLNCAECGEYKSHDEKCSLAEVTE